jgi:hypothetical protein
MLRCLSCRLAAVLLAAGLLASLAGCTGTPTSAPSGGQPTSKAPAETGKGDTGSSTAKGHIPG